MDNDKLVKSYGDTIIRMQHSIDTLRDMVNSEKERYTAIVTHLDENREDCPSMEWNHGYSEACDVILKAIENANAWKVENL